MSGTHTYALMALSAAAVAEIAAAFRAAGYEHAIHEEDGKTVFDMHGLAVHAEEPERDLGLQTLSITLERSEDWWVSSLKEVPGAHSQGKTPLEACENVMDAAAELQAYRTGETPRLAFEKLWSRDRRFFYYQIVDPGIVLREDPERGKLYQGVGDLRPTEWLGVAIEGPVPEEEKERNVFQGDVMQITRPDGSVCHRQILPFALFEVKSGRYELVTERDDDLTYFAHRHGQEWKDLVLKLFPVA